MTTAPHIPAPPPGPGVHPPFPAPPVEGRGRRIGLGFGIGAGVLVLVCGGGVAAVIGIGLSSSGALTERAQVAVESYLGALRDQRYDRAYDLLCEQAQSDESRDDFRRRAGTADPIASWDLGKLNLVTQTLPFEATYAGGTSASLEAYLGQDRQTGAFEVCDIGE